MLRTGIVFWIGCAWAAAALAQAPAPAPTQATPPAKLSAHVQKDIARHRAMALAHENAARCLEGGTAEAQCQERLRQECKGLAIGKYCGMRHEH